MYDTNINIDRPRNKWSEKQIEQLFVFCILDRAMSYEKVCKTFEYMKSKGLTEFTQIENISFIELLSEIAESGYRWPNQAAEYLKWNINNYSVAELSMMSRDELKRNIKGFGYKLASMFYNRLHPEDAKYAIIDIHIDRYLQQQGCNDTSYKKKEKFMQDLAAKRNISIEKLDWNIWNKNRIGNKKK